MTVVDCQKELRGTKMKGQLFPSLLNKVFNKARWSFIIFDISLSESADLEAIEGFAAVFVSR